MGAGKHVSASRVSLWSAGEGAPVKLGETQSGADGGFSLSMKDGRDDVGVLYLVAEGGTLMGAAGHNAAITLMATVGSTPP
jgi:hypothetical protein